MNLKNDTYYPNFKRITVLVFLISTLSIRIYSQKTAPIDYFRSPVDIPLTLAGTFGELRKDHFHAGIDIKTEGTEGKNIYAIADGYISRIKINIWGYGKSLYITHPNGLVSVYGHLKSYNKTIENFVKKAQYDRETYEIDVSPAANQIPVKKGDIVALSGNTGSSGGPHLHFEIRDEITENAYNPLNFHFNVTDNTKPQIFNLYIFPQDKKSCINGKNEKITIPVSGSNGNFSINENLTAHGNIGFALETNDFLNNSSNKCGIYSIRLLKNEKSIFDFNLNEISFYETRYINSHMDYYLNETKNKKIHRCYLEPNNKLSIYSNIINNGVINFNSDSTFNIRFVVSDVYGNKSELNFDVKGNSSLYEKPENSDNNCTLMPYNQENYFKTDDIIICIPKNSFYDTICFDYSKSAKLPGTYSAVHHIHHQYTPVHYFYSISIRTDSIPNRYQSKALIAMISDKGKIEPIGGTYLNGFVTAESRDFGKFAVVVDTTPPLLVPHNVPIKPTIKVDAIELKVSDNLSGIETYNGYIDEHWVLFEYEPKKNLLRFNFDESKITHGRKHRLKVVVADLAGNESIYQTDFYY